LDYRPTQGGEIVAEPTAQSYGGSVLLGRCPGRVETEALSRREPGRAVRVDLAAGIIPKQQAGGKPTHVTSVPGTKQVQ
jgi:hypothetical protein